MKTIDEMNVRIYIDYIQNFIVDTSNEDYNRFVCNYIPLINSVVILINGVCYSNNSAITYFNFDSESNSVVWNFTKENGGFDLEDGFRATLIYNFDMDLNNVESVNDVI